MPPPYGHQLFRFISEGFNPQGDSIFLMIFRWGSRIKPPTANRLQMSTGHCQIFKAVLKWI